MSDVLKYIAGFITAVIGAWGTVWLQRAKNQGNNENIYASHIDETLDRLEERTKERDDLRSQVMELQNQVKKQSELINSLNNQIKELTSKFNQMGEKHGNN